MGFDDAEAPEDNELLEKGVDHRNAYYQEDVPFLRNVGIPTGQGQGTDANAGIFAGTPIGDLFEGGHKVFAGASAGPGKTYEGAMQVWAGISAAQDAFEIAGDIAKGITLAKFDPFDYVGSMLMGWMLEHVEPMRKALDSLAGSKDMVAAYSASWQATSKKLAEVADTWKKEITEGTAGWVGATADAYRTKADAVIAEIVGQAALADLLNKVNEKMSKIVEGVRGIITEVLNSLAGMLLEIAAILIASAGTASPALIARAVFGISTATMTVAQMLSTMASSLIGLGALVRNLAQIVAAVVGIENELAEAGV
ncbi:hypothetical protein [Nocardia bhagyanarayanae]|uniref:Type VII secretion system (Wss) protein ESAT-6 n=1 Tax=Nocardia bhagyanarayanae TaxID=1215925 RepID=A0A543FI08_9NOCA|nr:hypothetical protein [Nocardia bhagyanarayanae]TQM33402.1 hypothetical protein FB390_5131 [Nocardia bhagyanarayanae]